MKDFLRRFFWHRFQIKLWPRKQDRYCLRPRIIHFGPPEYVGKLPERKELTTQTSGEQFRGWMMHEVQGLSIVNVAVFMPTKARKRMHKINAVLRWFFMDASPRFEHREGLSPKYIGLKVKFHNTLGWLWDRFRYWAVGPQPMGRG